MTEHEQILGAFCTLNNTLQEIRTAINAQTATMLDDDECDCEECGDIIDVNEVVSLRKRLAAWEAWFERWDVYAFTNTEAAHKFMAWIKEAPHEDA